MLKSMKHLLFVLLLMLQLPLLAQQSDTAFVFRFVPEKDVFYVPFNNNGPALKRLCEVLKANAALLQTGKMYISVSSYSASGSADKSATQMAYLRKNRVKSELITRAGLKESYFVTDRQLSAPYHGERNVVVIVVPASVEKVAQIAGEEAAETVRIYRQRKQIPDKAKNLEQAQAAQTAREAPAHRAEEQQAPPAETLRTPQVEKETIEQQHLATEAPTTPHTLTLRANLLRWATLTPDLGVEWRINRHIAVAINGLWTSWDWNYTHRRYAVWQVSPDVRFYVGKAQRGYLGAMYHAGEFDYKLSSDGKQGDYQGGALLGGYQLPIGKRLMLDFNLGVGYTQTNYDTYVLTDGIKVRTDSHSKNYWGINKVSVTLAWQLF